MVNPARLLLRRLLPAAQAVAAAAMCWKILCFVTACPAPLVVVISGSMEPAFHRGDILFLWNRTQDVAAGDIPVIWFEGHHQPMVHRVITTSWEIDEANGALVQLFTTKGDNNAVDDISLYPENRLTAKREEIIGFVRGYVPLVGWPALLVQEILLMLRPSARMP